MSTIYEPRPEKTNILVSDLVPHKPGCTATEDGLRLEISDLESRGAVYHLRGNHTMTLYEKRGKIRYHLRV